MRLRKTAILLGLIVCLPVAYWGLAYWGAKAVQPHVDKVIDNVKELVDIQYNRLSFNPVTQYVTLHDVHILNAKKGAPLADAQSFSLKIQRSNQQITSMVGALHHLHFSGHSDSANGSIHFSYQYDPKTEEAAINLDSLKAPWGPFFSQVVFTNFKPTLDLLFDYPSLQIREGLLEIRNQQLSRLVVNVFHQGKSIDIQKPVFVRFNPKQPFRVADLISQFPQRLLRNPAIHLSNSPLGTDQNSESMLDAFVGYWSRFKIEINRLLVMS